MGCTGDFNRYQLNELLNLLITLDRTYPGKGTKLLEKDPEEGNISLALILKLVLMELA